MWSWLPLTWHKRANAARDCGATCAQSTPELNDEDQYVFAWGDDAGRKRARTLSTEFAPSLIPVATARMVRSLLRAWVVSIANTSIVIDNG